MYHFLFWVPLISKRYLELRFWTLFKCFYFLFSVIWLNSPGFFPNEENSLSVLKWSYCSINKYHFVFQNICVYKDNEWHHYVYWIIYGNSFPVSDKISLKQIFCDKRPFRQQDETGHWISETYDAGGICVRWVRSVLGWGDQWNERNKRSFEFFDNCLSHLLYTIYNKL